MSTVPTSWLLLVVSVSLLVTSISSCIGGNIRSMRTLRRLFTHHARIVLSPLLQAYYTEIGTTSTWLPYSGAIQDTTSHKMHVMLSQLQVNNTPIYNRLSWFICRAIIQTHCPNMWHQVLLPACLHSHTRQQASKAVVAHDAVSRVFYVPRGMHSVRSLPTGVLETYTHQLHSFIHSCITLLNVCMREVAIHNGSIDTVTMRSSASMLHIRDSTSISIYQILYLWQSIASLHDDNVYYDYSISHLTNVHALDTAPSHVSARISECVRAEPLFYIRYMLYYLLTRFTTRNTHVHALARTRLFYIRVTYDVVPMLYHKVFVCSAVSPHTYNPYVAHIAASYRNLYARTYTNTTLSYTRILHTPPKAHTVCAHLTKRITITGMSQRTIRKQWLVYQRSTNPWRTHMLFNSLRVYSARKRISNTTGSAHATLLFDRERIMLRNALFYSICKLSKSSIKYFASNRRFFQYKWFSV
jgi:hypothetical protein